jgi:hypothetical protein
VLLLNTHVCTGSVVTDHYATVISHCFVTAGDAIRQLDDSSYGRA